MPAFFERLARTAAAFGRVASPPLSVLGAWYFLLVVLIARVIGGIAHPGMAKNWFSC